MSEIPLLKASNKILSANDRDLYLRNESVFSWGVEVGRRQIDGSCFPCGQNYASGQLGKGFYVNSSTTALFLSHLTLHDNKKLTGNLSTGISLFTAFISTDFTNILLSIFISGVGTGGVYLLTISFLQATTDQKMRGRVFGNFYTIGRIALLLSFITSGIAANYLDSYFASSGVETVLKISSLLIFISGLITFITSYRKIFKEFGIENSNFNNIKLNFKSIEDEPE